MGWKTFRDHFKITKHRVMVEGGEVLIGSGFIRDLVRVSMVTGKVTEHSTFGGMLKGAYPELFTADPDQVLELLNASDHFEKSVPVFTHEGARIIEKLCEEVGYPNVTHDGEAMGSTTHFATREGAVAQAKARAVSRTESLTERIEALEGHLAAARAELEHTLSDRQVLEAEYPGV